MPISEIVPYRFVSYMAGLNKIVVFLSFLPYFMGWYPNEFFLGRNAAAEKYFYLFCRITYVMMIWHII